MTELCQATVADPPRWAAGLGPRPDGQRAALRWEELLGYAAAYRETYGVTSTDPAHPLGEPPEGHNLRAHAWHRILDRWGPEVEASREPGSIDANDPLRREFGEPLMASLSEPDHLADLRTEESLSRTVHRREQLVRTLIDQAAREALAAHAPDALGAPAEESLLLTLRAAVREGWQPHRLLPQLNDLDGAHDPAALLAWRLHRHLDGREPPAPTAEPTAGQVERWKDLIHAQRPTEDVGGAEWDIVWRHAAAATSAGLDTDRALSGTTRALHTRTELNPREVAQHLVDHLAEQRSAGIGHHPALSWMSTPPPAIDTANLDELDHAIRGRLTELREATTADPPHWATKLGTRPDDPRTAHQWDDLLTRTAAYRETYDVRTNHPDLPLGPQPHGDTARAQSWHTLNREWRTAMNTEDHHRTHQQRLNTLRDNVTDTRDHHRDDRIDHREHLTDDEHTRRQAEEEHHDAHSSRTGGLGYGS
ncbi:hypothetical protein ACL03H_01615 [Saccharopolyspora sp. MS10]|uniref:hypothetical protein n=1 Tax=Saccharopolyspora sp. MS10 TaxID=3385973 RepID=UPI0039A33508